MPGIQLCQVVRSGAFHAKRITVPECVVGLSSHNRSGRSSLRKPTRLRVQESVTITGTITREALKRIRLSVTRTMLGVGTLRGLYDLLREVLDGIVAWIGHWGVLCGRQELPYGNSYERTPRLRAC